MSPRLSAFLQRQRTWALLLIGALLLTPAICTSAEWGIDQLMHELAQVRSRHARFTEKKFIAMLEAPVESSGELFYTAPDRLEKRTLKPKPESMVLDQDSLLIQRGRKKHRLQLQSSPELAVFIGSIRSTLAGDRPALERNYQLSLAGEAGEWTLKLRPKDEKMQGVVSTIVIAGEGVRVRSIAISQADGDHSLMLIQTLDSQ